MGIARVGNRAMTGARVDIVAMAMTLRFTSNGSVTRSR